MVAVPFYIQVGANLFLETKNAILVALRLAHRDLSDLWVAW